MNFFANTIQANSIGDVGYQLNAQKILNRGLWLRLLLLSFIYVALIVVQILQQDLLHVEIWQTLNVAMFFLFLTQVVIVDFVGSFAKTTTLFGLLLSFDALALGWMLATIGASHALFLILSLSLVALAGYTLGFRWSLFYALWISGIYNFVWSSSHYFDTELLRATFIAQNLAGFIVAFLTGQLGEDARLAASEIEEKTEVIKSLEDINELIVANIPSGLLTVDDKGIIHNANRSASKIFSDIALTGRDLTEICEPLLESFLNFRAMERPGNHFRQDVEFYNYKRERIILETVFSRIRSLSHGARYILMIQNVTELRNLEYSIRQKEKLAAVGQLAAGIAHEIRNPLASISGSIQLLSAGLQTQTADDKKLFSIVIREIDRLNGLITEFLDFVRPDVRLEDPIDINKLVKDILDFVQMNESLNRKVEQKTELRAKNVVRGNYDKLKQALLNIIINSYQAMNDTLRPEVFIRTFDEDERLVLKIEDNGCGIPKDHIRRIFEPFHTTKPKGTGLGLAITMKILEAHDAKVSVESEVGRGTVFIIEFPIETKTRTDEEKVKRHA